MSRILPILFNTDMVEAILREPPYNKTATRRRIKYSPEDIYAAAVLAGREEGATPQSIPGDLEEWFMRLVCAAGKSWKPGDILYVRETWAFRTCIDCDGPNRRPKNDPPCRGTQAVEYDDGESLSEGCFIYRAGSRDPERITWRPSIHMPREAARIWLKVKDVRVERLQSMVLGDFLAEGVTLRPEAFNDPENAYRQAREQFKGIWDATLKPEELGELGWERNPWVWVISFERCGKPE